MNVSSAAERVLRFKVNTAFPILTHTVFWQCPQASRARRTTYRTAIHLTHSVEAPYVSFNATAATRGSFARDQRLLDRFPSQSSASNRYVVIINRCCCSFSLHGHHSGHPSFPLVPDNFILHVDSSTQVLYLSFHFPAIHPSPYTMPVAPLFRKRRNAIPARLTTLIHRAEMVLS